MTGHALEYMYIERALICLIFTPIFKPPMSPPPLDGGNFVIDLFPGTRYIVVDCGGGTVDMTVHEMEGKLGTLRELYKADGGPYGSMGETQWSQLF